MGVWPMVSPSPSSSPEAALSHFIHLPGGSHYGFTDEGSMQDATISREDHQVTAAAGWLAWWKYTLESDTSALPYLRGDRMLLPEGPEIHTQYRERAPWRSTGSPRPATSPPPGGGPRHRGYRGPDLHQRLLVRHIRRHDGGWP